MILVIVAGATIFGHFLAITRIPFDIAEWVTSFNLPAYMIMGMIILVYLLGGCVIDALALIMLTVPIFYPVVLSLGYDPIWFGVIIVLVTQIGVITPPVGVNVYVVSGVARDIPLHVIFKGVIPLLAALIAATLLILLYARRDRLGVGRREREMLFMAVAGLAINAAIFGGLSVPVDRYQGRVIWIIPALAALFWLERRKTTRVSL
jgi:uncharacterized ion transporter superfamily protein YfcC